MWKTLNILFACLFCLFLTINAFNVELYEHKHFKGRHTSLDVRGCTNVPLEWDDTISSVEPSQCIVIFKHPNCQGPRVRLDAYGFGTAYLREINFEDKLSSLAPCNFPAPSPAQRNEF